MFSSGSSPLSIFGASIYEAPDIYTINGGDDRGDRAFPSLLVKEELCGREQSAHPPD